jgi:hypothetical protein
MFINTSQSKYKWAEPPASSPALRRTQSPGRDGRPSVSRTEMKLCEAWGFGRWEPFSPPSQSADCNLPAPQNCTKTPIKADKVDNADDSKLIAIFPNWNKSSF